MRVPFNPKLGRIKTDAGNLSIDRAFCGHYAITGAQATAESNTSVLAVGELGAEAASITTGFTSPAVPRNLKIVANKVGITSNIKIYGTNMAGEAIDETKKLNGTTPAVLAKAFASVTKVDLPIQTNVPAKQKTTSAVEKAVDAAGTSIYTFVSAATGAAFDVSVAFLTGDDTATKCAVKIAAGLNANTTFAAKWTATPSTSNVLIESKTFEAQDTTVNLTLKTAGASNVTLGSIAVDTVSGIAADRISIGVGKAFGLPYKLVSAALVVGKAFDNAVDASTIAVSATALESNTASPAGTPDGAKPIDFYIIC